MTKKDNNLRFFRTIISHKVEITGNKVKLFGESTNDDESITSLTEEEIVNWIFNNKNMLDILTEEVCNLPSKEILFKLQVKEPLLNKEEQHIIGDIDAILIPKKTPEHAVIIEFKRIKISTLKDKSVKTNKIKTTKNKGFSQIKKLRKFGYFKTYLGVIIEDDARNVDSANTILRRSKDYSVDSIYQINDDKKLESKAGLFFIEMTQPTGENFKSRFNFSITTEKEAEEISQSDDVTRRINSLIKE